MTLYEDVKESLLQTVKIGNVKRYNEKIKEDFDKTLLNDIKKGKKPELKHITLDKFLKKV